MASFKGYMRLYAKTVGSKVSKTEYTEDWADPRKRHKILGKPRKYSLTFYLFNIEGEHMVTTIDPPKGKYARYTQEDLGELIFVQVNKLMKENPYQEFDLINSYINVRA